MPLEREGEMMRMAAGGVDAGQAIWNWAANQIAQQTMGMVFAKALTPGLPGGEIDYSLF